MNARMPMQSYVWDIVNPNTPEVELTPQSPLCCLRFNSKVSSCSPGYEAVFLHVSSDKPSAKMVLCRLDRNLYCDLPRQQDRIRYPSNSVQPTASVAAYKSLDILSKCDCKGQ